MDSLNKLQEIRSNIGKDKTLVCVSKNKPISLIKQIYDLGERDFGENKVQEFLKKYEELPKDIRWHFIGTLQKNKVKYIVDKVYLIQSLDSISLAEEIEKKCKKKQCTVKCLVQVNLGREESKHGILIEDLPEFLLECESFTHINIKGLMCVVPKTNEIQCKVLFKKGYEEFVKAKALKLDNISMEILSMGMSNDYIWALEEGSNMVRIGQEIFGARDML